MFPKYPEYRKRGRTGEHEIASLLGKFCNIMPPEYDLGFDYFCELLKEDNSSSGDFFWVQAKTTQEFGEIWSIYIDKKTVRLWLSQFFPVFVLLFEQATETCYWLSVEEKRKELIEKLSDSNDSICIVIDRKNTLKRNSVKKELIEKIKNDLVLTKAIHGVPSMIGDGYVRAIPVLSLSDSAIEKLRHNVRIGLDYLIFDALTKANFFGAYELLKLLTEFDRGHYDHFLLLARVCKTIGKRTEARDNYNIAIGICKDDPNWNKFKKPEDASIEEIIEVIEKELNELYLKSN